MADHVRGEAPETLATSGYVVDTLQTALWHGLTGETVEFNVDDPAPGRYRLFAVKDKRYVGAPDEHRWKWEVGSPSDTPEDESENPADEELRETVDSLKETVEELREAQNERPRDPEEMQALIQARVLAMAVQNPVFMAQHGDKIALAALDTYDPHEHEPAFEDYKDSPMAATFFSLSKQAQHDPGALSEIGENLGAGIASVMDGIQQPERNSTSGPPEATEDDERSMTRIEFDEEDAQTNGDASMEEIFSEDAREVAQDVENHLEGQQDPDEEAV